MEQDELKRKLMGLWEKTTHSSKDLVASLFNYYFDPYLIEYKEKEGKIISAIVGIPYKFGYGKNYLKGLYLISISSEEGFQKKGIISELLKRFNDKVCSEYDFTFIIPHTELLADLYGTQGYFSSFFILEERFTPFHDFKNDYILSLTDSDKRIRELKTTLFEEIKVVDNSVSTRFPKNTIANFIENIESKGNSSTNLCHNTNDIFYILEDESIRKLTCFVSFDVENNITGVAFIQKEDIKRIKIVATYVADLCSYYSLLNHIKREYEDYSLSVNTSEPKYQVHSIIQQTYAASNPEGGDLDNTFGTIELPFNLNRLLQPLGMVKLLRFENILKYIAETRSDVDFKLHIRDYHISNHSYNNDDKIFYKIKNGKLIKEPFNSNNLNSSILNLSIKEISELLLRKNDSSNLIMEAFGIPRLNLQLRLLPC